MDIMKYIFPIQCSFCGEVGEYLCRTCKRDIKAHPEICPYCHKFSEDFKRCLDCSMDKKNILSGLIIPLVYSVHIKKLILKLKYYHKRSTVDFLVDRMSLWFLSNRSLQRGIEGKNVYVSGVPAHRYRKFFVKWYNQSELLAKAFAKKIPLTICPLQRKER
jgi:predicted amidophosphoribosyltransferase